MVASSDLRDVSSLLHPDVVLRSPVGFKPFNGAESVAQILTTVSQVLTDFRYERQFCSMDGHSIGLEFSASIANKQLKGIDIFRFSEYGIIMELEIMVRPFNALQALGVAMAKRMGVSRFRILVATWFAPLRAPK